MLYPHNIETKLGFDRIKNRLYELCSSTLGQQFVEKIRWSTRFDQVHKLLCQSHEMLNLLQSGHFLPRQNFYNGHPYLSALAIEGNFLTEEAYVELLLSLKAASQVIDLLAKQEPETYPQLCELAGQATKAEDGRNFDLKPSLKFLELVLDERGKLRDNASEELQQIRRAFGQTEIELRKKLETIFKHARNSGWIGDDFSLTVRGGRMVIPLAAEFKRKIKGFIHDESDTGKTIYMEPTEVLELNNQLRELQAAERRAIVKILQNLATALRPSIPQLKRSYTFMGLVDFIAAKAQLAMELKAILPHLQAKPYLNLLQARHPLLYLSFVITNKKVVPLNMQITDSQRVLLVSGPNAGGKSVMLKTVGLLQYMLQCGLLVPVAEGSTMGVFKKLFIDIGDEQSIENDLSTYSSHLSNMRFFTENADAQSLYLIDEFGTGTEPALGGAIAEAILEELHNSQAFGVINTHYGNLKTYANKTEGLSNAAMRFDAEALEPLFELEIGQPGSSFALEIAQKIGLKKKILHSAKQKLGGKQVNLEKLLKELEIEKRVFAEKNIENASTERKLKENLAQYSQLKEVLESQKKTIINTAKLEAKTLLKEANQRIEQTIKNIKEAKAEKETTKIERQELEVFEQKTLKIEVQKPSPKPQIVPEAGSVEVGSLVRIKGQDTVAEVLALKGKDAQLAIGGLNSTIKLNRLEKISRKEYRLATQTIDSSPPSRKGVDLNQKMAAFSFNVDIRGQRADEALQAVDSLIDEALLLGYNELRIVHGKGDGILRQMVRQRLKTYKQVASLSDEHPDRGGAGVTLVSML
jgi:DNA mismatch repair protein MutS2